MKVSEASFSFDSFNSFGLGISLLRLDFFSRNLHRLARGKREVLLKGRQLVGYDGVRCEFFLPEDDVFEVNAR